MAAVVPFANRDAAGVQQDQGCVKGCETGGVAHGLSTDESGEYGFEAGCVGGEFAGVDVVVAVEFVLSESVKLLELEGVNIPPGRLRELSSPAH